MPVSPKRTLPESTRRAPLCAALALALALPTRPGSRLDLDVGLPPGSPLDWSRSLPAITPGRAPLFSATPVALPPASDEEGRTRSRSRGLPLDPRFSNSFDLTRILTLDIVVELDWVRGKAERPTGVGPLDGLPVHPAPGDPMHWTALAALLRLYLHPSEAPRNEVEVHLIETGLAALPALEAADRTTYLRGTAKLVRERVTPAGYAPPRPLEPTGEADAYERMLLRFVGEELLRDHPYDPVGSFGWRLFPLSDVLEPYVAAHLQHPNAYLRRAAVSALGRYRTTRAAGRLVWTAVTSPDQVARLRALAALGRVERSVERGPLIARLVEETDLHERTALIGTLGRLRATDALPAILRVGDEALARGNGDLAMTAATAVAAIPPREHVASVAEFLDALEEACDRRALALGPSGGLPAVKADRPDRPDRRAELLRELAQIARGRIDPLDPERQRALLGRLAPNGKGPENPLSPPAEWVNAASIQRVSAPWQRLYLELLGDLGRAGVAPLLAVVDDPTADVALRGHALTQLPWGERRGTLGRVLEEGEPALRLRALLLADRDDHPRLEELARAELARCAERPAGAGTPEERQLALVALRALGARRGFEAADVLPLVHHATAPRQAFGDLPEVIEREVENLVSRARGGLHRSALRREARRLVDLVVDRGLRAELDREREPLAREVAERLASARAHRLDQTFLEVLAFDLRELLLAYPVPRWNRTTAHFTAPVPLEEEILLALGRTREAEAVAALADLLENRRNRLRSFACLALGASGAPEAAGSLGPLLLDPEPYTRWCAYLALARLTGAEERIDWMRASEEERFEAAQRMWKHALEKR